jgi:hypothetical protein
LFRNKNSGDGSKLIYIFQALIELAGDNRIDDFLAVVSDELRTMQNDFDLKLALQILPVHLWPRISEIARLRIENKLIRSIDSGQYDVANEECISGWLATWGRDLFKSFSLNNQLCLALIKKLNGNENEQNYVANFFYSNLPDTINPSTEKVWPDYFKKRYVSAIVKAVSKNPFGPSKLREKFLDRWTLPQDWQDLILQEIESVKECDPEYFNEYINFDVPF